jgi:Fur family ferric uptake transcriptional regulator
LAISDIWRDTGQVTIEPVGLDPAATERIGEFLRARGLRRMASRIQVLAVIEPVNGHLSVAEIRNRLPACLPHGDHAGR